LIAFVFAAAALVDATVIIFCVVADTPVIVGRGKKL